MRTVAVGTTVLLILFAGAGPAQAGGPKAKNGKACTVLGTNGNDHLIGTHGYEVICGLGGNDVITGGGGKDVLDGGDGDDQVTGGTGPDTVFGGDGTDTVTGGAGNDQIRGGDGTDTLDGGAGTDVVDGGTGDDTLDGGSPSDETDPANGGDRVVGGDGDDTVSGGPGADIVSGGTGVDTVDGGDGNDMVGGDYGDDTLNGGGGNDRLDGGEDTDTLSGGAGSDGVNGGAGDDELAGGDGDDTVNGGAGADHAVGGDGSDKLDGGRGDDRLEGGPGNDQVSGGAGNDAVAGGDGNDTLAGGDGNDAMDGGDGSDDMDGGIGDDEMDGGAGDDVVEGGPGVNICVNDPDDAGGDRCTDKESPLLDTASLAWSVEPSVSNAEDVTVKVRARLTDDRSGVVHTYIYFRSPEQWGPSLFVSSWSGGLVEGQLHDGVFEYTGTLPAMSVTGEWTVDSIHIEDRVHRTSSYYFQPGGSYTLTTSVEDDEEPPGSITLPPLVVTGETFDAEFPIVYGDAATWVTGTEQDNSEIREVKLRVRATDELTGVTGVAGVMRQTGDPNGPVVWLSSGQLLEGGDDRDGVWELTGSLPAYLPTGEWKVESFNVTDRSGRSRWYTPEEGGQWVGPLTVTGAASDEEPPTLDVSWGEYAGLTEADNSVDREVRLRVRASDDVSGVRYLSGDFCTAGARTGMSTYENPVSEGVWELMGTLPATTTPGDWRLCSVTVVDKAGRQRYYQINADDSYTVDGTPQQDTVGIPKFELNPVGAP